MSFNMADQNPAPAHYASVKRKFVLQDLLNFSDSSDDEHTSPHTSDQSAEPETETHTTKQDAEAAVACNGGKENLQEESNSLKKVCKKVEAGAVNGKKVSDNFNCRVRKSKKVQAKGQLVTENLHAEKEKREVKKAAACSKTKPKPKRNANQQNMTLADLGISFDFSQSSDEEKAKPVAGKVTESSHAKEKNGSVKKKVVSAVHKPKRSANLQDTTLADLGISVNFSDSSDEEKPKPMPEKQRISLIYQEKKKNPQQGSIQNHSNENKPHSSRVKLIKPKAATPVKDEWKESDDRGSCKTSRQSTDPSFPGTVPPSNGTHALVKSVGTVETTLQRKGASLKSSAAVLNSKPFLHEHSGKVKSTLNPCALSGHHVPLQHPSMSVIRSAHLSGNLLIDASPSEESLLPLSESTRLDSGESDAPAKQNFGHLLAYHSSPKLFDSSSGQSKDSSYEQLNIVNQTRAPSVTQSDQATALCRSEKKSFEKGKQAVSLMGSSENESLYTTCLSLPDVSSMYEAVDVSVQTSVNINAGGSTDVEKGLEALCLQRSADAPNLPDTDSHAECGDKGDGYRCERLENGAMAGESERHLDIEVEPHHSSKSKLAFNHDISVSGDSGGRTCKNADHEGVPDLMPDINSKENVESKVEQEKTRSPPQQAFSGRVKESTGSGSPLHKQQRTKLPSDSNYFSESHSDVDNVPAHPDVCDSSNLEASDHARAPAFSPKPAKGGKKISNMSEEKLETDLREHGEMGRTLSYEGTPDAVSSISNSQRWSQAEENSNVSRHHHNWREGVGNSSSSEDDDDKLEAFFQKLRTPARPAKDIDDEDEALSDFIVSDSDVESDEDAFYSRLTWLHDADSFFQSEGAVRQKRVDSGRSCHATGDDATSSEEEDDQGGIENEDDGHDDDRGDALSTPRSKIRPAFSSSQTPCEASLKWYTPATSLKTKPRRDVDSKDGGASVLSTKAQSKADNYGAWATPACLSRAGNKNSTRAFSFLHSLSAETPNHLRDAEARSFISQFKRRQEELSSRLFKLFNFTVFENQLPADLQVVWNKRLLKTAGLCKLKRVGDKHTAAIELSSKVCDTAERLRDTLIHEMCHAAVWVINRAREGHGPHWRYWAGKANRAHPEIPVIRRCHDYKINTKYIYKCVKCGYQVGRHSKSLDTEKKVCGHCRGHFQLLTQSSRNASDASHPATPRTPNPFAMFVKENYGSVKKQGGGLAHKEVMEMLSKEFAKTKIAFS